MSFARKYARARRMARLDAPKVDSRRVAKNTLVLYFRMLAVMVVGLFTSRIQLEALGVENYGLYQVTMATVGLFAFLNGSLGMASSRFLTVEMGHGRIGRLKRVFSTVLTAHVLAAVVIAVLLETVGMFVLDSKLNIAPERLGAVKWAFHCGVAATALEITQVPYTAVIIARERMAAFAFMAMYDVGIKLLIVYLLFVSPFDRLAFFATLLMLSSCASIAIYRIYCIRHFTESRYRRVFEWDTLKSIFGFMGWQFLSQIVFLLVFQTVTLLNQRYFGPVVVAASAVAAGAYGYVNGFITNFKSAANPQIMKLYAAKSHLEAKALLKETVHYSAFLLLVLGVPICFYAPEVLSLWLGDNVPQYAPDFLRLILAGAFFSNFDYSMFTIICADGRMRDNTLCDLIVYPTAFALIWLSIKIWGIPYTAAIGQCLMSGVLAILVKPFLLRRMANYTLADFLQIFLSPFVALAMCVGATYLVYRFMPRHGICPIAGSAGAVFLNGVVVFSLVASERVQNQIPKFLNQAGPVGAWLAGKVDLYLTGIRRFRSKVGLARVTG